MIETDALACGREAFGCARGMVTSAVHCHNHRDGNIHLEGLVARALVVVTSDELAALEAPQVVQNVGPAVRGVLDSLTGNLLHFHSRVRCPTGDNVRNHEGECRCSFLSRRRCGGSGRSRELTCNASSGGGLRIPRLFLVTVREPLLVARVVLDRARVALLGRRSLVVFDVEVARGKLVGTAARLKALRLLLRASLDHTQKALDELHRH
mmetsp:Transcript_95969/g.240536  ORF Transcript_95969/g.240536 Transcript_95969/m.240536 type:complete len:209 (-) Transcript_95969:992-1618(-)